MFVLGHSLPMRGAPVSQHVRNAFQADLTGKGGMVKIKYLDALAAKILHASRASFFLIIGPALNASAPAGGCRGAKSWVGHLDERPPMILAPLNGHCTTRIAREFIVSACATKTARSRKSTLDHRVSPSLATKRNPSSLPAWGVVNLLPQGSGDGEPPGWAFIFRYEARPTAAMRIAR